MAMAASFVAIFCVGVSGNARLLYVLLRYEDLRHVTSLLVLNMAASDLLFAATLPFWSTYHLSHWVFGPALCRVLVGAYFAGLYCGLMFLTALTVDRYVTVVRGRSARRGRRLACARSACAALWLVRVSAAAWEMAATGAGPGAVHNSSNSLVCTNNCFCILGDGGRWSGFPLGGRTLPVDGGTARDFGPLEQMSHWAPAQSQHSWNREMAEQGS